MQSPCDSCAFREGSETFEREPYNRFRGQIAALSGLPFFCHHGLDWRRRIANFKGMAIDADGRVQRLQVCAGWRAEVAVHIRPCQKDRLIRRGVGQACMETLEAWSAETGKSEKKELLKDLKRLFGMLLSSAGLKIVRRKRKSK